VKRRLFNSNLCIGHRCFDIVQGSQTLELQEIASTILNNCANEYKLVQEEIKDTLPIAASLVSNLNKPECTPFSKNNYLTLLKNLTASKIITPEQLLSVMQTFKHRHNSLNILSH